MTENEIYQVVVPDVPDVIPDQELYVFVPKASVNAAGVLWPSDDFVFGTDGKLYVNRDKFVARFIGNTTQVVYSETYTDSLAGPVRQLVGVRLSDTLDTQGYWSIPYRDNHGRFQVGTPSGNKDVVNKEYADKKLDRVDTTGADRVYVVKSTGTQDTYKISANNPESLTIVRRTSSGTVVTGTPINQQDATPKSYVDGKFSDAENYTDQRIQELKDNPDVVDIVATYADLLSYDTTNLGNKDIVRVLSDESQQGGGKSTYYKWNYPNAGWNLVGILTGESGTTIYVDNVSQPTWNADTKVDAPDRAATGWAVLCYNGSTHKNDWYQMQEGDVGLSIPYRGSGTNNFKVGNLTPTSDGKFVANKNYVDSKVSENAIEVIGYGRY